MLKGSDVEKMREKDNVLLAFRDVAAALRDGAAVPPPVVLEPAKADGFPKGWVVSDRAALAWSEDGKRVFFGAKEQVATPDTTRKTTDEAADVDVWNTGDDRVQSLQMVRAEQERNFTFRQAFDVSAKRYVKLTDETMRDLDLAPDGKWAVGRDQRAYLRDEKKLPASDFYRVNTSTGERTLIAKGQLTGGHTFGISPHGTHFLYWKDSKFQLYDLEAGTTKTLAPASPVSFVEHRSTTTRARSRRTASAATPATARRSSSTTGTTCGCCRSTARRRPISPGGLGAKNEIRFRLIRTEPIDPTVPRAVGPRGTFDLTKPVTLSAYGQWTKKAGLLRARGRADEVARLRGRLVRHAGEGAQGRPVPVHAPDVRRVPGPARVGPRLRRLEEGDRRQPAAEGLPVGPSRPVRLQEQGRRAAAGHPGGARRLQAGREAADDRRSSTRRTRRTCTSYSAPAYLPSMGRISVHPVSMGYLTMLPDIHFRTGSSHSDMLECVEAATRKVIEMGYADPKRIGVSGHSYSGEGAAYIGTMSKMFAAVGMGAGVVDLYNDFSMPGAGGTPTRAAAATPRSTTTSTPRGAGASRRGTSPSGTAPSRRSRGRRR